MSESFRQQLRQPESLRQHLRQLAVKMGWKIASASLGIALAITPAWAGMCDAILEKGVFGRYLYDSSIALGEDYAHSVCTRQFMSEQDAIQWSFNVGLPNVLSLVFGNNSSSFKQKYDEMCSNTSLRRQYAEQIHEELISADPVLVQGWTECLRLTSTGLRSWIEQTDTQNFVFTTEFLGCPRGPQLAQVSSLSIAGATCDTTPLKRNTRITSGGVAMLCTKHTPTSAATVVLNTNLGSTTAKLMAPLPDPPPPPPTLTKLGINIVGAMCMPNGGDYIIPRGEFFDRLEVDGATGSSCSLRFAAWDVDSTLGPIAFQVIDAAGGTRTITSNSGYSVPVELRRDQATQITFNMLSPAYGLDVEVIPGTAGECPAVNDTALVGHPVTIQIKPDAVGPQHCALKLRLRAAPTN